MHTQTKDSQSLYNDYKFAVRPGHAMPLGASLVPGGINFSISSQHGTACTLVLFERGALQPFAALPIPRQYRIGSVYAVQIMGLDPERIAYGYRVDGPRQPRRGHYFDPDAILLDPYARALSGREKWGQNPGEPYLSRVPTDDFDWGDDRPLETPIEDVVIYEMHVRGFTRHQSSGVAEPGTYQAIHEKIPYLKELGVNCVELMPVFEFDEFEQYRTNPETGEMLLNYWGYSPVSFFAPKAGYAASGSEGGEINELKWLIKDLHENGIEVLLDVVFNHTAEGNEKGPMLSFKGLDSRIYYILTPEGYFYNFSGTGNTFNCNHPQALNVIMDSLRYWVSEYHVDGFRFDLASIMMRGMDGTPLSDPPLLRQMTFDPLLSRTKLIAEPWDAQGLYHLGSFSSHSRWAEWNGRYRDHTRRFLKGDTGLTRAVAAALVGSPDLYSRRGPISTINFITAHDGFTLMDLVSYNDKHNEGNVERGDNGTNDNYSWNSGVEGHTTDPEITEFRHRRIKSAIALLMVSQGAPMILMGDEMGRTQDGNNNAYCQDSEISWLDWRLLDTNGDLFYFFKACVTFRRAHPVLRGGYFLRGEDYRNTGARDITWHGVRLNKPDWSETGRTLAFMLAGEYAKGGLVNDNDIYVAMNMHWRARFFALPPATGNRRWHLFTNSGDHAIHWPGYEPYLQDQRIVALKGYSIAILVGK